MTTPRGMVGLALMGSLLGASCGPGEPDPEAKALAAAAVAAAKAAEGFERADRFVRGWWPHRDPQTGLYPQNLFDTAPVWRVENSASDLWPFMVLTTWFTDRARYAGPMMDTLTNEIALTSRLGALPDDWNIAEQRFDADDLVDFDVVFGSAEYVKDGLIPIFERLGDPAFFARMTAIASQLCNEPTAAAFTTAKGELLPADDVEINGDVMLTMTRLYTATGDERYLDCSQRIAEYYLFENPVIASESYRLRDHGGEMTAGLVEAYVGLDLAGRATEAHRVALKDLLDRVLEVGRDEDGFFYDAVNLKTGAVTGPGLADTWGYTYAGYYAYDLAVGEDNYTNEVRRVLENLPKRMSYPWEPRGDVATGPLGSADGYADAIESAIYLLNREPVQAGLDYLESEIQLLFAMQQSDGVIEGWHGDGNFARTALLYAFMHSQGLFVEKWRRDVEIGAVRVGDELYVHLGADEPWSGGLCFDTPRHATNLGLPYDYPRLNAFPEWFTVEADETYLVETLSPVVDARHLTGEELAACLPVHLTADGLVHQLRVTLAR